MIRSIRWRAAVLALLLTLPLLPGCASPQWIDAHGEPFNARSYGWQEGLRPQTAGGPATGVSSQARGVESRLGFR